MYISIGKVARMIGVSATTLRRWDKAKTFSSDFKTVGGHRRYQLSKILAFQNNELIFEMGSEEESERRSKVPQVITYARVSSSKQREDLQRQQQRLQEFVTEKDWKLVKQYKDIGSGLNDKRKGFLQMVRDIPVLQPEFLVVNYSDRLARFGLELLKTICNIFSTQIVIVSSSQTELSFETQLVNDIVAVLYSFSGKLYRSRRSS